MSHRKQALYDRAGWRAGLLIPSWLVQSLLMLGIVCLFAYRLADTLGSRGDKGHGLNVPVVLLVWECTNLGFSLLGLILTFVEIGKYVAETLTPVAMLVMQIIKLVCSCGNLAVDIAAHVVLSHGPWSTASLVLGSCLLAVTLLNLIYSIIIDRRTSEYKEYSHPANVKHYGFNTTDDAAYPPQTSQLPTTSDSEGRCSLETSEETQRPDNYRYSTRSSVFSMSTLRHSLSIAGSKHESMVEADLGDGVPGQKPSTLDSLGKKRISYNHQRSTQFDEFLRRRSSVTFNSPLGLVQAEDFDWAKQDVGTGASATPMTTPQPTTAVKPRRRSEGSARSLNYGMHLMAVPEQSMEEERGEENERNEVLLAESMDGRRAGERQSLVANEEERPTAGGESILERQKRNTLECP